MFIFGESRGEEPFEESLIDVFGVLDEVEEFEVVVLFVLLLSRMKFRPPLPPWPNPEEFLMDCRRPNWVVPGVTPGA